MFSIILFASELLAPSLIVPLLLSPTPMAASRISERFKVSSIAFRFELTTNSSVCATDADMTISSSDGVLFKVYRKNLEVHSDVFANAEDTTRPENGDEIVYLTESSIVLDLLFQFMYRQPQPDLEALEFKTFASLAEAAEKYVVYSALTLCRNKMKYVAFRIPVKHY